VRRFGLNRKEGQIVVTAKLWGPSGNARACLALDTGATSTVVNASVLVLLGYDPAVAAQRTRITTGSGVEYAANVRWTRIARLGRQ